MEDIEIARQSNLLKIKKVAEKINIDDDYLEMYGNYKAKINLDIMKEIEKEKNGKLILVTSINPTPLGEGKTTVSIGLTDGLNKIGKKAIAALREPSLGPVFGIKGGATGGGNSQIAPMEDINLHFTGDIHAITSANNLLSAIIDNHIFYGNQLNFKKVTWKRCLDLNDRQLRKVNTGLSGEKNIVQRQDGFDISVASEIMAVFCLSENLFDLREKLGEIIVGYNDSEQPIKVKQLNAQGALTVLLKDAINPNLVQTLENNPAIIHGGPFANIAHGCNSIIATKLALKLADFVVTEAGFGADLGAEKFLNIKCRKSQIKPDVVVCVATIKALKYHGGVLKEDIKKENIDALKLGSENIIRHIDNLKNKFGLPVIVAINKYSHDTEKEIQTLEDILKENNVELSIVESWEKGSKGAIDLAKKITKKSDEKSELKFTYELTDTIKDKIEKICKNIYGASNVNYSHSAENMIDKIEKFGYSNLPICIAKTQYSFSDDPNNLQCNHPFDINIEDLNLKSGAGFIVVITGKIMTMPGLPKIPSAEFIDIDEQKNIVGIF